VPVHAARAPGAGWLAWLLSLRDVDRDGRLDLTPNFASEEAEIAFTDTSLCLEGRIEEEPFRSCDAIVVAELEGCGRGAAAAWVVPVLVLARHLRKRSGPCRGVAGKRS
jgi:hypothetical protein